ncbi:hypothetical protein WICMUC_004802 [Wickerhamomyces mucosus]|uniref:Peroxisomal membrane protein PMP27 n=1 Tax=Wickerhamomyces mucosus TaxID=1378264 RepID=A0A9P8T900_9ASCO|nr:hypothetical protein WICMUC_004802 [Wickerhamomyces mucosus]
MVLDTIAYHPSLTKLIKYLDSTAGREKTLRLIQYLVRFLAFYAKTNGFSIQLIQLFKSIQANATFVRKALRFLKPLNHFQDAVKAYNDKLSDRILSVSTVIRNAAYFGYLSLDSFAWFKILGLISTKNFPKATKYANWFWFIGLAAGLTNDFRKISITRSQISSVNESEKDDDEKLKGLQLENYKASRKLIWDLLDTFIVLNNLGFLSNDDGQIGLAGTLTSIFGVQDLWNATKI